MFNDDAGFELVNLQAQRDLNSLVKNDETRTVNRDRTTTIDKDETVTVHGQRTETVDKDESITIHQNRTETVDQNESITIHKNRKERVDLDETLDIGGNRTETVHKSEKVTIKGNRDKTVKGNDTLNVDKNRKENVHKSRSLNVDKNNTEFVKLAKSVTVGLAYATQVGTIMNTAVGIMQTEQIGRIKKTFVGKSYSITAGDEFKITVGKSSLVMNADGSIIITGSTIITQAEKENKVIGKDVLINPPGASNSGDKEPYPENEGYMATYGEPDLGGGGGLPGMNFNPSNPNEEWDPEVNNMMPKGNKPTNIKPKASLSSKILPFLLPAHSRPLLADKNQIKLSEFQYNLRKVSAPPVIAAGATPYIAAGYLGLPAGITKTAITSGVVGSGIDAGGQLISDPKGDFNFKQNIGVGVVSAATAGYGSGLAKGAGVESVSFTNIHKNIKNIPGLTIFGNQQMLNQVGSRSVKSATDDKSESGK